MNRRFGIELEITGITQERAAAALQAVGVAVRRPGYNHRTMNRWKIVPDGSVNNNGFEVVSPILSGEAGLTEAATVIDALKAAGSGANRSCGLHVHIEQRDLGVNDIRTIIRRYAAFENEIDAFMPPSRRGNNNTYCRSIRSLAENRRFQDARNMNELVRAQGGRYFKVNLHSIMRHGTLEFRQHNGIVDADRAMNWVRFLDAFIAEGVRIARESHVAAPTAAAPVTVPVAPNGRLTSGQRRVFDLIRQPGGATIEVVAERCGIQIHSARAVVTRIRQCGYTVRVYRAGDETRYEVVGAATLPGSTTAPTASVDSLWAGVDNAIATFYRNRAAVLALN